MISKVTIENFKKFGRQEFSLGHSVVLAGPNNSGKTSLLQAISTWWLALQKWRQGKGSARSKATRRTGQAVTRKDFTALPLSTFDLLWNNRKTALRKNECQGSEKPGTPRLLHITLEGPSKSNPNETWQLTMELRYQGPEQIYVKPILPEGTNELPPEAENIGIVHCPPFSGIGSEERKLDIGAQNLLIGEGKPGDIIRNLILEISEDDDKWGHFVENIQELFNCTLIKPDYAPSMPFIRCEYLNGIPKGNRRTGLNKFELASAGSGFHQVLLLLSFFYARPASVLLLDEPDAHLHVILQRQIYDRLRSVAGRRGCQLLIATHSEVFIDGTDPESVLSFLGKPHPLAEKTQRDQVREALKRVTTLELLLAEQGKAVLYCEGETDFRILSAFANALDHEAKTFFQSPFLHALGGKSLREAKAHYFALNAVHPDITCLVILDQDAQDDGNQSAVDGMKLHVWERYEIENYLLVPTAIERFLNPHPEENDLFQGAAAKTAQDFLREQFPPTIFTNPLDDTVAVRTIAASKDVFPQLFDKTGTHLGKSEYYRIAEIMEQDEIHPEIVNVLDSIANLHSENQNTK